MDGYHPDSVLAIQAKKFQFSTPCKKLEGRLLRKVRAQLPFLFLEVFILYGYQAILRNNDDREKDRARGGFPKLKNTPSFERGWFSTRENEQNKIDTKRLTECKLCFLLIPPIPPS